MGIKRFVDLFSSIGLETRVAKNERREKKNKAKKKRRTCADETFLLYICIEKSVELTRREKNKRVNCENLTKQVVWYT